VYSDFLQEWIPSTSDQERWNSDKIVLENGSTIYARAIKMKRGLHLDRVVCDDLTTESSTLSDDETWGFFTGALLPQTTTKTAIITVDGTPIRVTDINSRLAREDNGWNKVKLPAIIDPEMKTLLSPGRFTWQGLMEVKRDIGSIKFEAEYMLNPIDDSVSLIKNAWVRQCFDNGTDLCRHRSYFQEVFLGVDFAFSDRVTADWSIFLIIGRHDGKFYLLDYERRQGMGGSEQLEHVRELHSSYRFDMIGLEENSIMALTKEVRRMGLPIKLFRTGTVDEKDKLKPDMTGTIAVSKRNLVLRLATTFENNDIVIPFKSDEAKRKAEQLLNECVSWAQEEGKLVELGVHPDIPMALGFALEAATRSSFIIDFATF
jgi:phage terminase large subunit-like protein